MSDKTVAEKLLIREGYEVSFINEPDGYRAALGPLPANVQVKDDDPGGLDLIQLFITSKQELEVGLGRLKGQLKATGLLWVTYPKGTSKVKTDTNRDTIRAYAESTGFKAVAMISVDDTWSALKLKIV